MEETVVTGMEAMFTNIGTVITEVMKLLGTVTTSLLGNEIFQIAMGLVFLSIIIGLVFYLVAKAKRKGR